MKAANVLGILLALAATAGTALWVGRATATGAPQQAPLTYAGTLTDQDGKPYPTAQEVVVKFWDAASGGAQKCAATPVQAEAGTGNFQVTLPAECVQAVRDQSELWTELTVGPQKVVLPRSKVAAVPYALEADSAKVAGSAAAASGGLKTQVEGLVSDVAGLKAKPGGSGPQVKDANGVTLGALVSLADVGMSYYILTATGNMLYAPIGVPQSYSFFYQSTDCTGPAYFGVPSDGYRLPAGTVVEVPWLPDPYYVLSGPVGQACPLIGSQKQGSYWSSSACQKGSSGAVVKDACALVPTSGAKLGLPDKIARPLSYVP